MFQIYEVSYDYIKTTRNKHVYGYYSKINDALNEWNKCSDKLKRLEEDRRKQDPYDTSTFVMNQVKPIDVDINLEGL